MGTNPKRAFINVLLPAPFGPKMPVILPGLIVQLTSLNASCVR